MIARATIRRWAMPPESSSTSARPSEQPEPLQQLLRRRPGPTVAHAEVTTVEVQVLEHVQRSIERVRLRNDADDLLGEGRVRHDVDPADSGAAPRSG